MTQNRPIIGVTGITGSGTSTVADILAENGGFVCRADAIAHELMRKGEPAHGEIVDTFGTEILDENGEINRRVLGARVFGENKDALTKLEAIIHPRVIEQTRAFIAAASGEYSFAVIDAPLLIESGMNKMCDTCWLVTAPDDVRLERIIARDGISREAAERRLKSRSGDDALRSYADFIIENDGDIPTLREKIVAKLELL